MAIDETSMVAKKAEMEELWKLFIHKVAIDAFGEKAVINGSKLANFYGSVESHYKLFQKAIEELVGRENGT